MRRAQRNDLWLYLRYSSKTCQLTRIDWKLLFKSPSLSIKLISVTERRTCILFRLEFHHVFCGQVSRCVPHHLTYSIPLVTLHIKFGHPTYLLHLAMKMKLHKVYKFKFFYCCIIFLAVSLFAYFSYQHTIQASFGISWPLTLPAH